MTQTNHNLISYYASLGAYKSSGTEAPKPKFNSKTEFAREITKQTGLSLETVRRWCKGDNATKDPNYLQILSSTTGISIDNLFNRTLD